MSLHEREEKIINILHKNQTMKNSDLAKMLYVSPATMRRDLDVLEQKGLIIRKYGECTLSKKTRDERNFFLLREQHQSIAKQSMAFCKGK
jgi:DeoR/GlpR family transcriptional regulator of sugar metabolism